MKWDGGGVVRGGIAGIAFAVVLTALYAIGYAVVSGYLPPWS